MADCPVVSPAWGWLPPVGTQEPIGKVLARGAPAGHGDVLGERTVRMMGTSSLGTTRMCKALRVFVDSLDVSKGTPCHQGALCPPAWGAWGAR